ncbi:unnamed protein product [Pseudo-nitzschia multistriata]|uniref:Uncharacterized protein n=1 Tax=Pseudo-nitzschia multistriata TaxID=183589 RepID=A0A448ZBF4_9STRA|nr:unnamed protein product [Pseudo-nitzschia multistriata]
MLKLRPFRGTAPQQYRNGTRGSKERPQRRASVVTKLLATSEKAKEAISNRSALRKSKEKNVGGSVYRPQPNEKKDHESTKTVKKWMRRVLPKEFSSPRPDGKPGLFPRIRKTTSAKKSDGKLSPTVIACCNTVTDESSSKYSRSKNDDSPREMILAGPLSSFGDILRSIENNGATLSTMRADSISKRHNENIFFEDDDTCESAEVAAQTVAVNIKKRELKSSCSTRSRNEGLWDMHSKDSKHGKEEEPPVIREEQKNLSTSKAEILSKLFPLRNQNTCETEETPINTLMQTTKHDEKAVDKENDDREIHFSQFRRADIISSLFPFGHPDDRKKEWPVAESNTETYAERNETNCSDSSVMATSPLHQTESAMTSREIDEKLRDETNENVNDSLRPTESGEQNEDKFIGLVITFDPTWDLLVPDESNFSTIMPRSRLKKFHEIENYTDSLLGNFAEDEFSEESIDLIAGLDESFDTEPSFSKDFVAPKSLSGSFELGFHFDRERFSKVDPLHEEEICFYSDDESSIESRTAKCQMINLETMSQLQNGIEICFPAGKRTEVIFRLVESDNAGQDEDVCCSTTTSEEYTDCIEYEQQVPVNNHTNSPIHSSTQSPIPIFESTPELHSPVLIKELTAANLYLPRIVNKDASDESSPTNEAEIATPIFQTVPNKHLKTPPHVYPVLSPRSGTSTYYSILSKDTPDSRYEGKDACKIQFYDAVMEKSPAIPSNYRDVQNIDSFHSPMGVCNST